MTSTANFCSAAIRSLIDLVVTTCPLLKNFDVIISLYLSFSYIKPTIQAILYNGFFASFRICSVFSLALRSILSIKARLLSISMYSNICVGVSASYGVFKFLSIIWFPSAVLIIQKLNIYVYPAFRLSCISTILIISVTVTFSLDPFEILFQAE